MKEFVDKEMDQLRTRYPNAQVRYLEGETAFITIPDIPLPTDLWNKEKTTVQFRVDAGYPFVYPWLGFFTDSDLRLKNGDMPSHTHLTNSVSHDDWETYLRFRWVPQAWKPHRDTLLTFVRLIKRRLEMNR